MLCIKVIILIIIILILQTFNFRRLVHRELNTVFLILFLFVYQRKK